MKGYKTILKLVTVAAGCVFLVGASCEKECDSTTKAINDLNSAKTQLVQGTNAEVSWPDVCGSLSQFAEIFVNDAQNLYDVAESQFRGLPTNCEASNWVQVCRGGWYPSDWDNYYYWHPYGSLNIVPEAVADERFVRAAGRGGGHAPAPSRPAPSPSRGGGGGWHPSPVPAPRFPAPTPRIPGPISAPRPIPVPVPVPHPVPRPLPVPVPTPYPPYWYHRSWDWQYRPEICSSVQVCTRFGRGPALPGYDKVVELANDFRQLSYDVETTCRKSADGATLEEVNALAKQALERIDQRALPGVSSIYNALSCSTRRGH